MCIPHVMMLSWSWVRYIHNGCIPLLWPHYIHYPIGYLPRYIKSTFMVLLNEHHFVVGWEALPSLMKHIYLILRLEWNGVLIIMQIF
jgi:hypothetical protein